MKEFNGKNYFTKSDLKDRGWSDKAIELFLPFPDRVETNPHCETGAPMRLYLEQTVATLESLPEWTELKTSRGKKRSTLIEQLTKYEKALFSLALETIAQTEFEIPVMDEATLWKTAAFDYDSQILSDPRWAKGEVWETARITTEAERVEVMRLFFTRKNALALRRFDALKESPLWGQVEEVFHLTLNASIDRKYPALALRSLSGKRELPQAA